jgi:replicative DNA helicase
MLSQEARVDNAKLMTGKLDDADWSAMTGAAHSLMSLPISIVDDGAMTVAKLRAKFRREVIRLKRKHGEHLQVKVVVVDYIQLMTGSGANRDQEIGSVSRDLRAFAKEFNVALIELSQNNREGAKKNDRPQLTDLRESGSLEQDAAKVMFLYNPTANKPPKDQEAVRAVIVAKNRDGGGTGDAWCKWDGPTTRFFVPAHPSHEWCDDFHEGLPPTHWQGDE